MILKDLPFYYLSCPSRMSRLKRLNELISEMEITATTFFNNSTDSLRQNRISVGFINLLKLILERNIFPCVTIDDDVQLIKKLPESFPISNDIDFIVLGGSLYSPGNRKIKLTLHNDTYYRVYYMMSYHSMIIPRRETAMFLLELVEKSLKENKFLDKDLSLKSEEKVFVTPKDGPYFYQDNYNEKSTRFLWENIKDKCLSLH